MGFVHHLKGLSFHKRRGFKRSTWLEAVPYRFSRREFRASGADFSYGRWATLRSMIDEQCEDYFISHSKDPWFFEGL